MSPAADLVRLTRDGGVAVLALNRPEKLNALSAAVEGALLEALAAEEIIEARAVVIHGVGRAFSAGADITEVREQDPAAVLAYYGASGRVYEAFAALPQPTVAAVHGYCLGGGLELALAADVRIAETGARFGCPEIGLGILPGSGGLLRLVRAVGTARARELILLGRKVEAGTALAMGLVTEVVPDGDALPRALDLARDLADLSPLAVAIAKQAIDAVAESPAAAALLIERLAYAGLNATGDAAERQARFGSPA
jgi:enoyl-CoA hydratase/carnithine racemase